MDDVVLWVEAAGLGDHLIYSTVPELFARRGRRVYVSNSTPTRNDEVRRLLYNENPFVIGWTDEPPNAGTGHLATGVLPIMRFRSSIHWIEVGHGLPATNLYPRIYYRPRFRPELADIILIDPHSISQRFPSGTFENFVKRLELPDAQMRVVESRHSGREGRGALPHCPRVHADSLHEYADMVYSCRAFIGTESGSSAIASAIRQAEPTPEIFALTTTFNWNRHLYIYPNVSYTIIGPSQGDL